MSIIAKYKFDSSIYADLIPEFNAEFTNYTVTDEIEGNIITRTIESDSLPTLMRLGRAWVEGETDTDSRTDSLLEVLDMNTSGLTNCHSMFRFNANLTSISCEWDTCNITDMCAMFEHCYNLIALDLSNFNTSRVTNMNYMFNGCQSATTLDASNFDTSNVATMYHMFYQCHNLTSLDLSNFDTSKVTDASDMFNNTRLLKDIGMLYCDQSTINKIASSLPADITQTIWVEDVDVKDLTPVEGVEFKQYAKNTEVMLTSPLLEGDKLIVKDGKLYHYHKMGMVVLDGSENYEWQVFGGGENGDINRGTTIGFYKKVSTGNTRLPNQKRNLSPSQLFSDRFKVGNHNQSYTDKRCITTDNTFNLCFDWNELPERTSDGVNQWLQQNPTTVVYELEEPYYELISEDTLDISLITESSDITNSSNIPLNMTINNRGLSTVAMSPSTTYTIAFDKDTDGEVVVNLCGNEVTTTDNIVEITTPSKIDDELIFYGDGVEVSNVRLLEGSVSGDSIPRESFEGLKSSFEDGYIENMVNDNRYRCVVSIPEPNGETSFETMYPLRAGNRVRSDLLEVKSNTTYTVHSPGYIVTAHEYNSNKIWIKDHLWHDTDTYTFSTRSDCTGLVVYVRKSDNSEFTEDEANSVSMILLEEEDFNNLGKYKVEYKVTGKNKFDIEYLATAYPNDFKLVNGELSYYENIVATTIDLCQKYNYSKNTQYTLSGTLISGNGWFTIDYTDGTRESIRLQNTTPITSSVGKTVQKISTAFSDSTPTTITNIQIEEGTQSTEYEPYKECIKTFYLNSPLLEGDTIEDINGVATHVKRKKEIKLNLDTYTDILTNEQLDEYNVKLVRLLISSELKGENVYSEEEKPDTKEALIVEKANVVIRNWSNKFNKNDIYLTTDGHLWLAIDSTLTSVTKEYIEENVGRIVARLASPIYETISTESILCDSYVNGHLDFDTNIPINKVDFKYTQIPLRYMQGGTNYTIQFNSDNVGKIKTLYNGNSVYNVDVVKGLNKILLLTSANPKEYIVFDGIGFNASNIQVVATDRNVDFGYFKGLQSSFESETDTTIKILTKDIPITLNNSSTGSQKRWDKRSVNGGVKVCTVFTTNPFPLDLLYRTEGVVDYQGRMLTSEGICTFTAPEGMEFYGIQLSHESTDIPVNFHAVVVEGDYSHLTLEEFSHLEQYKVECKVVGKNKLNLPYTEQNKLYTDGGSWSNKFSFNVIKDKTYTFSLKSDFENVNSTSLIWALVWSSSYSTNPDNQIYKTTGRGTSCTFTADKTGTVYFIGSLISAGNKFWDFQLEESTVATSYEPYQEYTKTIYLNSPLLKGDTIEVHNGKLCHYHKMGMVVFDGSEDEGWIYDSGWKDFRWNNLSINHVSTTGDANNALCDKLVFVNYATYLDTVNGSCILFNSSVCTIKNYNINQDIETFRKWLQADPLTAVYKLAEPYYEEITPLQEDLIITSVKEGDLHIDTIVPVSSKVTYNVNVQLLTDFEQSIVEQVQATQTTDLQSILDEEIDN